MRPLDPNDQFRRACVDPGKEHAGVACGVGSLLAGARLIKPFSTSGWPTTGIEVVLGAVQFMQETLGRIDELIIEWPKVYSAARQRDPNDLLPLAGLDMAIATRLYPVPVTFVEPARWKGNIDADVVTERIRSKLSTKELDVCQSKDHNVLDGCGLWLWRVGRLHVERF